MSAEIVHGDCLAVLPTIEANSIDAVVMDPPYCSGGFTEAARRASNGSGLRSETRRDLGWFKADNMGTHGLVWLLRAVAVESLRVLKGGTSLCVFTDWRMVPALAPAIESAGFRWQNMVVWDKGSAGIGRGFRATHEIVLQFTKGTAAYYSASEGNVLREKRQPSAGREHQTQKPVDLMRRLLRVVSPVGGVVLDPFAGSGSTGVAAVVERRRFLGIERDEDYAAIARARIATAQAQPSLFTDSEDAA